MIKRVVFVFLLISLVGLVFADEGWGDINTNISENLSTDNTTSIDSVDAPKDTQSQQIVVSHNQGTAKTKYTTNFYIALGLGTLAVLVVLYMVYLFIRGPAAKWKKPKPIKQ